MPEHSSLLALPEGLPVPVDVGAAGARLLPTLEVEGMRRLRRLTRVVRDGTVEHAFHPVFSPDRHAAEVLRWLRAHPARAERPDSVRRPPSDHP